ncbi:hypothetical protein GCM10011403_29440 [Pseudohongiella nitratireducens]|uniref:Uncharacterized protein n=1 Tax=Pseudohongiella nitratireducens TaxID=1768907 RepID=A0A916VL60_9GAMM|nr:hypothetical protein [Pseudohongiella nitratireducens]GFZ84008.1 hypothetical protein GCM10011403_29440 [Pseudohongiella nitratireducens]
MAIRANPSLPNRHTGYIACSGYGKSQALKQNTDIPKKGARVLLWDPDNDHKATHFDDWSKFVRAVVAGMKSGKGFRLAWAGEVSQSRFESFCRLVWECLDGQRLLYIIIEELADVQNSPGKASQWCGQLFRRARKYGGIIHWCSQRSEEISKTVFSQTENYFIGYPNDTCTPSRVSEMSRIARCTPDDLYRLKPLQFRRKKGREATTIQLKYKKI